MSKLARATDPYQYWPETTKYGTAKQNDHTTKPSHLLLGGVVFSRSLRLAERLDGQVYDALRFCMNARTTDCVRAPIQASCKRGFALDECIRNLAFHRTLAIRMHSQDH